MIDMITTEDMMKRTKIIIPARLQSSRLPNKLLFETGGKSLLQWTYERASQLELPVMVLTSEYEVFKHCYDKGMECISRPSEAMNGTQRIAEFTGSRHYDECLDMQWVINWQADEPLIDIDDVKSMIGMPFGSVRTMVAPIDDNDLLNRDVAKAVFSRTRSIPTQGYCHWFSRAPMAGAYGHCGIYMYSLHALQCFHNADYENLVYAKAESLEQLVWIEGGLRKIRAVEIKQLPHSINTSSDWITFRIHKEKDNVQNSIQLDEKETEANTH